MKTHVLDSSMHPYVNFLSSFPTCTEISQNYACNRKKIAMELRTVNRKVPHQIEEVIEYAKHKKSPFTNNHVLSTACAVMVQSKVFKEAYRKRRRLA